MTFRLTTLLYLFALLAASMALVAVVEPRLTPLGLLLGAWIFWGWKCYKRDPRHYQTWPGMLQLVGTFVLLPIIFVYLLRPSVTSGPPQGPHQLEQLVLALQNYHRDHGRYPPPYVADASGRPLYSWRVLILPYIDEDELAKKFRDDEPWDSPHNFRLLTDLYLFRSKEKTVTGETNFVAIVGAGTLWDPDGKVTPESVADGVENTLLLVEIPSRGIQWSEPIDLSLDEALALLEEEGFEEKSDNGYFVSRQYRVRNSPALVAMANGAVYQLPPGLPRSDAMALLTTAGGVPPLRLDSAERRHERVVVHWHRITNASLWLAIALLPLSRRLTIFPAKPA